MRAKWKLPANDRSKQAQKEIERQGKKEWERERKREKAMLKGRLEDSEGLEEKQAGSAGSAGKVQIEQGKQLCGRLTITL